ncbi:hypothetical protein NP493_173g04024 [Ridgeia piscesae]|uniref:Cysteine-rich with EGF-like domain protein 2 n=1 Tax=Ridgeia piscesae TaxID=27915 RepID=A0AAD9UFA5_RIDPI|nr:hypothetical protein NP493_173g04024 [Ridgeia piscesae]
MNQFHMQGVKSTAKSNFGGGNTAWEERKLNSYAFSETRLVEIVDKISEDEKELAHMIEEHEELIEHWWFKEYAVKEDADLLQFLCIDNIKVCCPNGTFGSDCSDCAGGRVRPCKDNGDCSGDGTRTGTGKCSCNIGYHGELCDECKEGYYEVEKNSTHTECKECDESCDKGCDEEGRKGCHECKKGWNMTEDDGCVACDEACDKCTAGGPEKCVDCSDLFYKDGTICKACHESCKKSCSDGTPATCEECKDGWTHTETGCQDLNECESDKSPCSSDEYCINSEGSYKCSTCHSACDGCTGAGTDNCNRCKPGYKLDDTNSCTDIDECDTQGVCAGEKQTCVNSPGSYKCNCDKGYKLKDGKCMKKETKKTVKKSASKPPSTSSSSKHKLKKKIKKKRRGRSGAWELLGSLLGFCVAGVILRRHIGALVATSIGFWCYLYWFTQRFEMMKKK